MRTIKLIPKANEDLGNIWCYSYHHSDEPQADRYVGHLSDVLQVLNNSNVGTSRPELGEGILVLPFKRHVIYLLQSPEGIIVIRIPNRNQCIPRHLHWD